MSDLAIRVDNLSKVYRIGVQDPSAVVRQMIRKTVTWPMRTCRSLLHGNGTTASTDGREEFWALRDVSFELRRGVVLGIVGRNGAGKSTLLKILSRITDPSSGTAEIYGRVGSLLEVGTGFHPDLTGRENVFLNGAILGMRRAEILKKFDEIVAFAEVEQFIDTPVKHYSSGMYTRLAFAVAAHLEPEVLIVDEVLAVGDLAFQKKCLGMMDRVAHQGRTVLFVSHNMNAMSQLTHRVILLSKGRVVADGPTGDVIEQYLTEMAGEVSESEDSVESFDNSNRPTPFYKSIEINGVRAPGSVRISPGERVVCKMTGSSGLQDLRHFRAGVHVVSQEGVHLMTFSSAFASADLPNVSGEVTLECVIDEFPLIPGRYFINVGCMHDGGIVDLLNRVMSIIVRPEGGMWPGMIPTYRVHGYYIPKARWSVSSQNQTTHA